VRAYNASWDFYKGMSAAQIESQLRSDTAWQRPTWPLGRLGSNWNEEEFLRDPLGVLDHGKPRRAAPSADTHARRPSRAARYPRPSLAGHPGPGQITLEGTRQASSSGR